MLKLMLVELMRPARVPGASDGDNAALAAHVAPAVKSSASKDEYDIDGDRDGSRTRAPVVKNVAGCILIPSWFSPMPSAS